MVGIILLKNAEEAFSAGDINTLMRIIIENVIGVSGAVEIRHDFTGLRIENSQLRWLTKPDKQPMMRFVQRHGKIGRCARGRPRHSCGPFFAVYNGYLL